MRKRICMDVIEMQMICRGEWIYTGICIDGIPLYVGIEPEELEALTVVEDKSMALKTLTAKSPAEARGIRKALKAAGLKFEFKSTGKRRTRKRNPAKKKRRAVKRVRRTRSKSRRRR